MNWSLCVEFPHPHFAAGYVMRRMKINVILFETKRQKSPNLGHGLMGWTCPHVGSTHSRPFEERIYLLLSVIERGTSHATPSAFEVFQMAGTIDCPDNHSQRQQR